MIACIDSLNEIGPCRLPVWVQGDIALPEILAGMIEPYNASKMRVLPLHDESSAYVCSEVTRGLLCKTLVIS